MKRRPKFVVYNEHLSFAFICYTRSWVHDGTYIVEEDRPYHPDTFFQCIAIV